MISKAAIKHFKELFNLKQKYVDRRILNCIPTCITDDDNILLTSIHEKQEIKDVVFSMSSDSSTSPDGYMVFSINHVGKLLRT